MHLVYGYGCLVDLSKLMELNGAEYFEDLQLCFEEAGLKIFCNDESDSVFVIPEDEYQEFDPDFAWAELKSSPLSEGDKCLLSDYTGSSEFKCLLFNVSSVNEMVVDSTLFDTMNHMSDALESLKNMA